MGLVRRERPSQDHEGEPSRAGTGRNLQRCRRRSAPRMLIASPSGRSSTGAGRRDQELPVVVGARPATQQIPVGVRLARFLAKLRRQFGDGCRARGQTAGQLAGAELEREVLTASARAEESTLADLAPRHSCSIWSLSPMRHNIRGCSAHELQCISSPFEANPRECLLGRCWWPSRLRQDGTD